MVDVTAPGLGSDQNAQMDYPPMQCYDGEKSYRRVRVGGTGCERPLVPLLGTTDPGFGRCWFSPTFGNDLCRWASGHHRRDGPYLDLIEISIIMSLGYRSPQARSIALCLLLRGGSWTSTCQRARVDDLITALLVAFESSRTCETSMQLTMNMKIHS